jgi:small subunit ribosomal protein S8
MSDPISDMLSGIKNAQGVRAETVDIPYSKIKEEIVKIMVSEGFMHKYEELKRMDKRFLRISLKYDKRKKGIISGLKRISKQGRRVYANHRLLPRVQAGFGTAIVTTSSGVMTEESARAKKLGGEIICYIW